MERFGVVIGSGIGGLGFMEQQNRVLLNSGPRRVSPYLIPAMIAVRFISTATAAAVIPVCCADAVAFGVDTPGLL